MFIRTSRPIPRDPAVVGRETIIHLGITEFARVYASFSQIISAEYSPAEERRIYALAELEINGKD